MPIHFQDPLTIYDSIANRPSAAVPEKGTLFIDRNTGVFYRTDGVAWTELGVSLDNMRSVSPDNTTTEIQTAIDSAVDDRGAILFQPGVYSTTAPLTADGPVSIFAFAGPEKTHIAPTSAVTTYGFTMQPIANQQFIEIDGLYFDMAAAGPGAIGVFLDNIQNARLRRIKTRNGAVGVQTGFVAASHLDDVQCFNPSSYGIRSIRTSNRGVSLNLNDCLVFQTAGATSDMVAGMDFPAGEDMILAGCRVLRTPGIAFHMGYGLRAAYPDPNTNAYFFMVNCEFDGADGDGVPGSNLGAAAYFLNAKGLRIANSWFSSFDLAGPMQPGIIVDGGVQHVFNGNWISGKGVRLRGTINHAEWVGNQFAQADGDVAWTIGSTHAFTNTVIGTNSYAFPNNLASAGDLAILRAAGQATMLSPVNVQGAGVLQLAGAGSPEGVYTAGKGSSYQRTDGGAGTTLYIKESGSGNTGWVAK